MNDGGFGPWIEGLIMAEEHDRKMLKPCPFCGEQVTLHAPRPNELNYSPYIRCGCNAEIWGEDTEDVIERWNRRVSE